jgi:hypothetical protein
MISTSGLCPGARGPAAMLSSFGRDEVEAKAAELG